MSDATQENMAAPGIPAAAPSPGLMPAASTQPWLPLLVLAFAILLWVAYQSYALFNERAALLAAAAQLAPQAEAATKVRASLDNIAAGVKRLAEGGNANARVIVDELARRGVTINPNSAPANAAAK